MKILFKQFDWEKCLSNATLFLGPPLILLATTLISIAVYLYFAVLRNYNNLGWMTDLLQTLFGVYIVVHIFFQYIMAIKTDPGSPVFYIVNVSL